METLIVTGLSGAGKSQAVHCLEDLGYYCIDNMPPRLIADFVHLAESAEEFDKAAFVVDVRSRKFFSNMKDVMDKLREQDIDFKIMYLEASDAVLVRRYKETRRIHPLAGEGSNLDGITREREILSELRKQADYIIDTSLMKTAALNEEIRRLLIGGATEDSFTLTVESFGFKYGMPQEADWVIDVRFIPNPFYVDTLKPMTGNDKPVSDYVLGAEITQYFLENTTRVLEHMIPYYIREGKYNLVLAIGCTGGQHRSVAIANEIGRIFSEMGKHTVVIHREL